jgi:hypothetical protein
MAKKTYTHLPGQKNERKNIRQTLGEKHTPLGNRKMEKKNLPGQGNEKKFGQSEREKTGHREKRTSMSRSLGEQPRWRGRRKKKKRKK